MSAHLPRELVIATRASRLALWQSEHIAARLRVLYPSITVRLLPMSTKGDEILDRSLAKIGGKGLFIKELENALLDGRAHLAVHSLKDLPVDLDARFALAAVTEREDPRDALVLNTAIDCADLASLPAGSVIGTSSLRRAAQILEKYPHLQIAPLRGNLDTRLGKLDAGEYAAIVLAASGLKRLGYTHRIAAYLPPETMLPAAGQGALGIECLSEKDLASKTIITLLAALNCAETAACVAAERAVAQALGASCSTPLAAFAENREAGLYLRTWAGYADGHASICAETEQLGNESPQETGQRAAQSLQAQGAADILGTVV